MDYNDYGTSYGTSSSDMGMGGMIFLVGYIIAVVVLLAAGWKIFTKAKRPGWAIIIPLYNIYILLKIVGRPGWWLILFFIPVLNIIIHLIVSLNLAKSYGRSDAFGIFFLWLFPIIGYLVLGFGSSKYKGPVVK